MSAEGKKKRGIAGLAKAQSEPFRLNGWSPDWQARSQGCFTGGPARSGGSVFMRGFLGGIIAENCGFGHCTVTSEARVAHAMDRCTHPMLAPTAKERAA